MPQRVGGLVVGQSLSMPQVLSGAATCVPGHGVHGLMGARHKASAARMRLLGQTFVNNPSCGGAGCERFADMRGRWRDKEPDMLGMGRARLREHPGPTSLLAFYHPTSLTRPSLLAL